MSVSRPCSSAASPQRRSSTTPRRRSIATRPASRSAARDPRGTARRPLRRDRRRGALRAAEAAVAQAETRLARRRVTSPANAKVQDVFFRAGEVVNAGQPVLSLLPPQNLRLRFYVPEPLLATLSLGQAIFVTCDSCPAGLEAKISFISREAEYTPPVIFSEQERAKLVFRVEARPTSPLNLPLGLPLSVSAAPAEKQ